MQTFNSSTINAQNLPPYRVLKANNTVDLESGAPAWILPNSKLKVLFDPDAPVDSVTEVTLFVEGTRIKVDLEFDDGLPPESVSENILTNQYTVSGFIIVNEFFTGLYNWGFFSYNYMFRTH